MFISSNLAGWQTHVQTPCRDTSRSFQKKRSKGMGHPTNPLRRSTSKSWTSAEQASQVLRQWSGKTIKPSPRCKVPSQSGVDSPQRSHSWRRTDSRLLQKTHVVRICSASDQLRRSQSTQPRGLANSEVGPKLRRADTSKVHPSICNQCFIQHSNPEGVWQ